VRSKEASREKSKSERSHIKNLEVKKERDASLICET
jgi:hypothetical protein